jgi:hypothetical protein
MEPSRWGEPGAGLAGAGASDGGCVHDDFRRLVLSRRSLLVAGGALAVQAAAGPLGPGGPAAAATTTTTGLSGQLDLPQGWFNDAEVQLKWTVGGPHGYPPVGTVDGEPVALQLTPSLTSRGLKVYTFKGRFGAAAMQCTVDFGADGDSFRANGSVGASQLALTCASQPPGTKKWPVGGTIGGQAFALTVNTTGEGPFLAGTLGAATFQLELTNIYSGPDVGETGGSKGRGTFTVVGSFRQPHSPFVGHIKLVYVLQGYNGVEEPPLVTVNGRITGPSTALLAGLALLYGSALQY